MEAGSGFIRSYRRIRRRKALLVLAMAFLAVVVFGLSLTFGGRSIGFLDAYGILFDHIAGDRPEAGSSLWLDDYVLWNVRLPRGLFALVAGAVLAVSGAVMQSVLRNPLADAYTTGVSSGACLGVAVATVLGMSVTGASEVYDIGTMVNAFVFSLIPVLFIVSISPYLDRSPSSLILAGVAITYIFNSMDTLLLVLTDSESLADIYVWQVGTVSGVYWDDLPLVVAVCIPAMVAMGLLSNRLNILSMGDAGAKSLGMNVDNLKTATLVTTAFAVSVIVCNAGIIGFIGLIVPHLIRIATDADNRFLIPASAMAGAILLLGADVVSRVVSPQGAIPVGVVISFIGAPVMLYLILRRRSHIYRRAPGPSGV